MTKSQSAKIATVIKNYPYEEDKKTTELFSKFGNLKRRTHLTKEEAIEILKWKSPRPLPHYEKNTDAEYRIITEAAFSTEHEGLKMHTLRALKGVHYPAASAILMFHDPKRYPVIDIRVWQQLYAIGFVKTNPRGQSFSLDEWLIYLTVMREIADEFELPVRHIEKRFFDWHKDEQKKSARRLYTY